MSAVNTSFLILSSILVLFMTPGLAFFYGGLVSRRNVVNTMLSVFFICGLAIVLWFACGYSLAFNGDLGGVIGNLKAVFFHGVALNHVMDTGITTGVYSLFQMMFAIITPALFIGAVVGRINFRFLVWFIIIWSLFIYYPMVHLVWSADGWLAKLGTLDFAGGTVVHINAGVTALMLSIWLGPRTKRESQHYNLPWVLLGTTILWIGWYGFNAGSALAVNSVALQAVFTTTIAAATSMVAWMIIEVYLKKRVTLVGTCTGTLCGLVGITPAAGYVTLAGAFWIGMIATIVSYVFVEYAKPKLKFDDPLDAFGCHGMSGIWGSIATGLFATHHVNSAVTTDGLFYGGGSHLLMVQIIATIATMVFVCLGVSIVTWVLKQFIPMRVTKKDEYLGLDIAEHGEMVDDNQGPRRDISQHPDEFRGQLSWLKRP